MAADVSRDPLPVMEELDGRHGQAGIDELVAEGVGDGVVVPVKLDMVVDVKCGRPHLTSSVALLLMWPSAPFCPVRSPLS
jgi:hypothetical protein